MPATSSAASPSPARRNSPTARCAFRPPRRHRSPIPPLLCAALCRCVVGIVRRARPLTLQLVQAEDKNIKLFASLHLGKQQKVSLACLWRQWHSGRSSLDEELAAALTQLSGLPSSEEIPADAVMYIAICAGAAPLLPGGLMDAVGMLRSAARWGSRLIGIGSESTSAADMAFRKVLDVHERDAQLLEEIMSFMTAPGAVLTPRQHAQFCDSCVRSCVPLVDLLRLAQTAAMEEKRMMLLRPFVFTNSSVMAIGN